MTGGIGTGLEDLRATAAVVVAALLPRALEPTRVGSLAGPLAAAGVGIAAAVVSVLAVAVDLARAAWGSGAVAVVVAVVVALGPVTRLAIGATCGPMAALRRCAPLLRALDLGGAPLARHGALAACASATAPAAVLGTTAALVLAVRAAPAASTAIAVAVAAGAVAAAVPAVRVGARLAHGASDRTPRGQATRRLAITAAVSVAALAVPQAPWELPPAAVGAAGIAVAAWIVGDGLAVDARPWLRLQATLIDCGASALRVAARAAGVAAAGAAAVGAAVGLAAGAVAGTGAGLRTCLVASAIAGAIHVALVLEPDPAAALSRGLAFVLVGAPAAGAMLTGAAAGWLVAASVAVAAVGAPALARRLA